MTLPHGQPSDASNASASADLHQFDDAAYVLGALSPADRDAFEQHLVGCAACTARVAEIADVPALLAGLTAADFDVPSAIDEPVPDLIRARLLAQVGHERRRRRWFVSGLSAAVAACVLALVIAVWPHSSPATPTAHAFSAVAATSPVQATAALTAEAWGTSIEVHCHYTTTDLGDDWGYDLVAITADGKPHYAGDWKLPAGHDITYVTGIALPVSAIKALEIHTPNGPAILRVSL